MKSIKKILLPIYLIFNMLYILIGSYLVINKTINICNFSKGYIILLILNVLVIIGTFIKKKIKISITDLFLFFMIIFGIISVIYAIKPNYALYGFKGRYEGLYQILYYYSVYLLSNFIDNKYKKIIIYFLLFCGLIEGLYAFLQVFQFIPVITQFHHNKPWATGFITNPNFFGSLMIICLSYSIGLFIDISKKKNKVINGLLIFIFMICLSISNTLSALIGLIIVYLYLLIYIIKNKKYKDFLIITLLLLSAFTLMHVTKKSYLLKDFIRTKDQTIDISKGNIKDNYGSNRIYIWKNSLKVVPENIEHGVGIDNFYYAFGRSPLSMKGWFFDKAHNEYLQILVCEGLFALISYLLFYSFIVYKGIRNKEIYLVLPVIGYLVQAFFNISVIEVAPFFFIALGLCNSRDKKEDKRKKKIGIIGHFGGNKSFFDGQTIKTKEINNYIENYYDIKTDKFDTYYNKKYPFFIINNLIKLLNNNDIIIVVIAIRGYKILMPLLLFLNKFYKRRIFDFVVGGSRYKIFNNNNYITRISKKIDTIYVETNTLKKEYNSRGLNNVEVISNFKDLNKTNIKKEYNNKRIKVCIFSRILKEKGIEDSINSIIMTNKLLKKNIFELDIYGFINKDYENEFNTIIINSPKYIKYKGTIPYNESVSTLEKYDLMLFLTYYKNEGFAGTLIDAFNSGLPIIATDWHNNFEILKDGYTGIKVNINDPENVSNELLKIYNNIDILTKIRNNCLKEADKYNKDKEMKKFINRL